MDDLYMDVDYSLPLNSVEIPLSLGWEFTPKFNVKAGVSALWLFNKNIEYDEVGFDWHFGLGYKLNWVELSLNYQQGFNGMNFRFRDGSKGWKIMCKRRVIRLNANIPKGNFIWN